MLGECALALVAYFIRDWRSLTFVCAGSCGAFLVTALMVPESPRWLLSKVSVRGAYQRNRQTMERANGCMAHHIDVLGLLRLCVGVEEFRGLDLVLQLYFLQKCAFTVLKH